MAASIGCFPSGGRSLSAPSSNSINLFLTVRPGAHPVSQQTVWALRRAKGRTLVISLERTISPEAYNAGRSLDPNRRPREFGFTAPTRRPPCDEGVKPVKLPLFFALLALVLATSSSGSAEVKAGDLTVQN